MKKDSIKIIVVVGARPNFVKIGPLFEEFRKHKKINPIIVHTGQHYDYEMSDLFFKSLNIPHPKYNLGIGSGLHGEQTAKILENLEKIFLQEKPDLVMVIGDVNSTLAGALAAAKLKISVCHVESGLRSFDKSMPEEINRVLTDHISDLHFCPTKFAVDNLKKEGIKKGVYNTGDVVLDIFLKEIKNLKDYSKILEDSNVKPKEYILLTIHRAANTENVDDLLKLINCIAETGEDIVFPCHPRTKAKLKERGFKESNNLKIIEPVGYSEILYLEKNAKKIVTDSGGLQKEAFWLKVPCITLRNNTEWVETVKDGWNVLVGSDRVKIAKAIKSFKPKKKQKKYFGNGKASRKITDIILKTF